MKSDIWRGTELAKDTVLKTAGGLISWGFNSLSLRMSNFIKGTPEQMKQADNERFLIKNPDKSIDYIAAHNKHVIESTIQEYEAMRIKKAAQFDDHYAERADAVISFIRSVDKGNNGSGNNLEKYFGKRMLAYLRGQQIRDQLMNGMTVKNKDGIIVKTGI